MSFFPISISDMQNGKEFPYHCKIFLHVFEFVSLLQKTVYDTSVFEFLDNNLCLSIVYVNNFLLLVHLFE